MTNKSSGFNKWVGVEGKTPSRQPQREALMKENTINASISGYLGEFKKVLRIYSGCGCLSQVKLPQQVALTQFKQNKSMLQLG